MERGGRGGGGGNGGKTEEEADGELRKSWDERGESRVKAKAHRPSGRWHASKGTPPRRAVPRAVARAGLHAGEVFLDPVVLAEDFGAHVAVAVLGAGLGELEEPLGPSQ
jgi:hypothetical protein